MSERDDLSPYISRFDEIEAREARYYPVVARLPQYWRKRYALVGRPSETGRAPTPLDHVTAFSIVYLRCEPGHGLGSHGHPTAEVFIPISGTWQATLGEERPQTAILGPRDIIAVPPGAMHDATNLGDAPAWIMAISPGTVRHGGAEIHWSKRVRAELAAAGIATGAAEQPGLGSAIESSAPAGTNTPDPDIKSCVLRFDEIGTRESRWRPADMRLAHYDRKRYAVVGRPNEGEGAVSPLDAVTGFNMTYLRCRPGCGIGGHGHATAEVFIPMSGRWRLAMGPQGERSALLEPWDVVAVPPSEFHGAMNVSDEFGWIMTINAGHGGARIHWAPSVLAELAAAGLPTPAAEMPGASAIV